MMVGTEGVCVAFGVKDALLHGLAKAGEGNLGGFLLPGGGDR